MKVNVLRRNWMRDDNVLSNDDIDKLSRHFLETGTLDGINENLTAFKAKTVWQFLQKNYTGFLRKQEIKV